MSPVVICMLSDQVHPSRCVKNANRLITVAKPFQKFLDQLNPGHSLFLRHHVYQISLLYSRIEYNNQNE